MQSSNLSFNYNYGSGCLESCERREDAAPITKKQKLSNYHYFTSTFFITDTAENSNLEASLCFKSSAEENVKSMKNVSQNNGYTGMSELYNLDEIKNKNELSDDDFDLSDKIDTSILHGKNVENPIDNDFEEKEKVILKVKGQEPIDILPEGWVEVTHNSGMPIYLHKESRVCSVSKPYFLGPGSARKHEIPISAIPCLHYLKELEKEKQHHLEELEKEKEHYLKELENEIQGRQYAEDKSDAYLSDELESAKHTKVSETLDYLAVRDYCQKRFEFQTITVRRFGSWKARKEYTKQLKYNQRSHFLKSTKSITPPLLSVPDECVIDGNNINVDDLDPKSTVQILAEYVQRHLKTQPTYILSYSQPFEATVMIKDRKYGCGFGSSKKKAKLEAAKAALKILISEMEIHESENPNGKKEQKAIIELQRNA